MATSVDAIDDGWVLDDLKATILVDADRMADLVVDLAPRSLMVQDRRGVHGLDLPFEVDTDACRARFRAARRELTITLTRVEASGLDAAEIPVSAASLPRPPDCSDTQALSPPSVEKPLLSPPVPDLGVSVVPDSATNSPNSDVRAMLAELHEGPEDDAEVDESEGNSAFAELRALLAEGPAAVSAGLQRRLLEGKITRAFCIVLRVNLRHALEANQPNKARAFRRMQQEIRTLLTAEPSARASHAHAPRVGGEGDESSNPPRAVEPSEMFDAVPLRDIGAKNTGKKTKVHSKSASQRRISQLGEQVAKRLSECGWAVLDGLLDASEVLAIRGEMEQLEPHFHASEIWVGHQAAAGAQMTMPEIRGDKILWMCGHHPQRSSSSWSQTTESQRGVDFEPGEDPSALQPCSAGVRRAAREGATQLRSGGARRVQPSERWMNRNLANMLDAMDSLVVALRESPSARAARLVGLADRSDAMLAVYPGTGARFQAHVDNTAGDGRRLSCLCYLNDSWDAARDGGELCVHPKGARPVAVAPIAGRVALFYADNMLHEVRPAQRHRYSVNVWYYDTEERDRARVEAMTKGRIGGQGLAVSDADNAAARELLQAVLGGSGGPATAAELERLAAKAELLPRGAAHMVAQVTMGSAAGLDVAPADVAHGLRTMPPAALDRLRGDLSVMKSQK